MHHSITDVFEKLTSAYAAWGLVLVSWLSCHELAFSIHSFIYLFHRTQITNNTTWKMNT